ncbi:hypothetical protein F4808DRAFT_452894 [Astrocystis sublimbata]|nr:hypothetical protein F4808DRAFT_452894 [Astrocystis sublimbata]
MADASLSPRISRRRKILDRRPLYATVLIFSLLASVSFVARRLSGASTYEPASALTPRNHEPRSLALTSKQDCHLVHDAPDQCAFVQRNCGDEEVGLIDAQPLAFIIFVIWLGLLFTTIGIAASDFFSVNLSTISTFLGLSESLAGVTFLALGNGSPDVFSTFAAMSSNSGSMAIGELIGAAGFITTVVAGSMALVREFKVARKTFVRDICFFIGAVAFAVGFLSDEELHYYECLMMIGFYMFYVLVVVGWHAYSSNQSARRAKEAASRAHVHHGTDELEPYRDNPDDNDVATLRGRASAPVDIDALEGAPSIESGGPGESQGSDSDKDQFVAAEMANSMRVNRPRGRRSTTTITPIRPSLVGALEFRSVLASLQKEGNVRLRSIHHRTRSGDNYLSAREPPSPVLIPGPDSISPASRSRALSSGNVPPAIDPDIGGRELAGEAIRPPSLHVVDGRLAPPPMGDRMPEIPSQEDEPQTLRPTLDRLYIPSSPSTARSTPRLDAFPTYTDSPLIMTPGTQQPPQLPQLNLPSPVVEIASPVSSSTVPMGPKPVKWWPYTVLPPPHILSSTLFPTLQAWRNKSIWDKFVSIVSVPTIFLLVITLPVVEVETVEDASQNVIVDQPSLHPVQPAPPVRIESDESANQETEWQRYRRSTRSKASSRGSSPSPSTIAGSQTLVGDADIPTVRFYPSPEVQPHEPPPDLRFDTSTKVEEDQGWNRWLLILQIFTGPIFCVLIVWANFAEDLKRPIAFLVKSLLISLVISLVLLAILLATTSPTRRPKYHVAFCFLGFIIAIAWISTVAGEVVGVLKAFGVILDISEAILGLTVFAVGNSVGDLVADVTVARLGYPVMALSACFGGPLLNILLGIGLGGAYQAILAANKHHDKHPDAPYGHPPYHIKVTGTLMVSTVALLITLLALLVVVPINKWMMTRKIGWGLIALWTVTTVLNLVIETTGVWQDVI